MSYTPSESPAMDPPMAREMTREPSLVRESSPAVSPTSNQTSAPQRHRKNSSTGGGRAWSEEEEAYLIETRMHKMPYKHIAAQLKKTELACRLHYHQLSFGGKRRRRGASVCSSASYERRASSISPFDMPESRESTPQRQLPAYSPPRSPESDPSRNNSVSTPYNHIPILPKPVLPAPSSQRAAEQTKSLRLITSNIDNYGPGAPSQVPIDMARLEKIYDSHRLHFWSMISRSYGCNVSPTVLEDAWRRHHTAAGGVANFPPTPSTSPQTSHAHIHHNPFAVPYTAVENYGKGFTPVNNGMGSASASGYARSAVERSGLAISSLLTEDKEIRSPQNERRFSYDRNSPMDTSH